MERIVDVWQSGIGTRRRAIDFRRAFHVQSLVRSFVVENFDEVIEPGLLLEQISRGGLGGLFFQSQMHALVTPVLLRVARLDPLEQLTLIYSSIRGSGSFQ